MSTKPESATQQPDDHADVSGAAKAAYDQGWAAWQQGDLKAARVDFAKAVQLAPAIEQGHSALGVVLYGLGEYGPAIVELETALKLDSMDRNAEENLAQVLAERPLAADEMREMLGPVVDVLAYLHKQGIVHGDIKPSNILANGDQLKLSSDALSRAGEPSDGRLRASAYNPPESSPGFIPMPRTMSELMAPF